MIKQEIMNESLKITRIYHPYNLWEDYKCGFHDSCTGELKDVKIQKVLEMFNSEWLTREYMFKVIKEWKYSCEHNLTNESLNKIAYIGQSACCLYSEIPNTITMEAWSMLDDRVKLRSDNIAIEAIKQWNNDNKLIQLCLNFD